MRQDGRNVLSLPFNPNSEITPEQQELYELVMRDYTVQKEQQLAQVQSREKVEAAALKKVWSQISKRDVPKAYRCLSKYHADTARTSQSLAQACQKELRKKVLKSHRLQKESTVRIKKLTREVLTFWKKRDRELADLKRKKEKMEKEIRKQQEKQEEQDLQKRRLEYLMQQSEIYAHFMANKMGMGGDQKKEQLEQRAVEEEHGLQRVQVDQESARRKMAQMINEDRDRLREFSDGEHSQVQEEDLDVNRFDTNNN